MPFPTIVSEASVHDLDLGRYPLQSLPPNLAKMSILQHSRPSLPNKSITEPSPASLQNIPQSRSQQQVSLTFPPSTVPAAPSITSVQPSKHNQTPSASQRKAVHPSNYPQKLKHPWKEYFSHSSSIPKGRVYKHPTYPNCIEKGYMYGVL